MNYVAIDLVVWKNGFLSDDLSFPASIFDIFGGCDQLLRQWPAR